MVDWSKLNGGDKHFALKQHRAEIMTYYEVHGEQDTRKKYNIRKDLTWQHFLNPRQVRTSKLTKADKAIARAEITEQGLRDVKREVQELKTHYGKFVPYLAEEITRKFFIPLISGRVELPPELEYKPGPDPLDITDFVGKLEK